MKIIVRHRGERFHSVNLNHSGGMIPDEVWIFGLPKDEDEQEKYRLFKLNTLDAMRDSDNIHVIL